MALPLGYNVRNLRERWPVALLAIVSIALVVAAVAVMMAVAQGFAASFRGTGRDDNAIVVSQGSNSEVTSFVELDERRLILDHLAASEASRQPPPASWEWVSALALPRRSDGRRTNVVVRSITPDGMKVRSGITLTSGRLFRPGFEEVVVGRRIRERLLDLEVGGVLKYGRKRFQIVGEFESQGAAFESEIWGDFDAMRTTLDRPPGSKSVIIRLKGPAEIEALDRWLRLQNELTLRAIPELKYYEDQAGTVTATIKGLGGLLGLVMGVGAVFAAMNTMYRVVASRTREIGTLRAIGFSRRAILASFVAESAVLGLAGGALGCLAALTFNGYSTSTSNLQSFSEVAFAFRLTPEILASGMAFALAMGVLGGLLPAARAARLPIAAAVRED